MYFEPSISVKCCPKLHIKQLGRKGVTDEKGGPGRGGGSGPPDPPSGHDYELKRTFLSMCDCTSVKTFLPSYKNIGPNNPSTPH